MKKLMLSLLLTALCFAVACCTSNAQTISGPSPLTVNFPIVRPVTNPLNRVEGTMFTVEASHVASIGGGRRINQITVNSEIGDLGNRWEHRFEIAYARTIREDINCNGVVDGEDDGDVNGDGVLQCTPYVTYIPEGNSLGGWKTGPAAAVINSSTVPAAHSDANVGFRVWLASRKIQTPGGVGSVPPKPVKVISNIHDFSAVVLENPPGNYYVFITYLP